MKSAHGLPQGWHSTTLGQIRVDRSAAINPANHPSEIFELYSIPAYRSGRPEVVPGSEVGSTKKSLQPGTVVVSKINPRINRIWVIGDRSEHRQIGSSEWIPFFPLEGLDPKYLAYFMQQNAFRNFLASNVSGVGGSLMRVKPSTVDPYPIVLAPELEQRRIVDAIESYFTRLDDAVATMARAKRKLKRYRASVLNAALAGRLVPNEAELARAEGRDYEPATLLLERILAERRNRWEEAEFARMKARGKTPKGDKWKTKYTEPSSVSQADLPNLPEGWRWVTMAALVVSGPTNGLYVPRDQYGCGTPILRIDDYQTDWSRSAADLHKITISEVEAAKYRLSVGNLVINRVNSPSHLGKSLVVQERHLPAVFESNMMRLGLAENVVPSYIQYYLESAAGKARLTLNAKWAVNQASINQDDVGATPVPLPPEREQQRIVTEIERLLSVTQTAAVTTKISVERCARLRQLILTWAFEGRIVDQDPADESASRLLERIQTELESTYNRHRQSPGLPKPRSPKA